MSEIDIANEGWGLCHLTDAVRYTCRLGGIGCLVDHELVMLSNVWRALQISDAHAANVEHDVQELRQSLLEMSRQIRDLADRFRL